MRAYGKMDGALIRFCVALPVGCNLSESSAVPWNARKGRRHRRELLLPAVPFVVERAERPPSIAESRCCQRRCLLSSASPTKTMLQLLTIMSASKPFPGCLGSTLAGCPSVVNTSVHWLEQNIDHFNWGPPLGDSSHTTFKQRFFVYDKYWDKSSNAPVFFYFGNEDNVELYVNHTGLMWESAEEFKALLVFGEHRYYGESLPYQPGTSGCMNFLTSEQAMADFAYLIDHLRSKAWGATHSAFIGFGGSYGGMIGSWFRVHYPNAIDGVIAASAPIWSFAGLDPPYDFNAFNEAVTFDASTAGGSTDACKTNLKATWPRVIKAGETAAGRALLSSAFRTCHPIRPRAHDVDDAMAVVNWAEGPWATMAMGNYPYSSSYLMHGDSMLPPWPVRAACSHLAHIEASSADDAELFSAVREAAAVYHNNTGSSSCFDITGQTMVADDDTTRRRSRRFMTSPQPPRALAPPRAADPASCLGDWDYQWCTEMTQPFTQGTPNDMFYCPPNVNCSAWSPAGQQCQRRWGVTPRPEWARVALGGKRIEDATNIVFSNGGLDPWHPGGVLRNLSDSLQAIVLPNGAHHIDLMFSDPGDAPYPDIAWARAFERAAMHRWVEEHAHKRMAKRDEL